MPDSNDRPDRHVSYKVIDPTAPPNRAQGRRWDAAQAAAEPADLEADRVVGEAVAEGLVARARNTAQPPVSGPTVSRIRELIARSSLGTPGAVELRDRTSPELSALVRQLGDLRNRLAHSHSVTDLTANEIHDLMWIAEESERLGLHDTAQWALSEVAAGALHRLARSYAKNGQPDVARTWLARANTLRL